jgi:hypothetical protein
MMNYAKKNLEIYMTSLPYEDIRVNYFQIA